MNARLVSVKFFKTNGMGSLLALISVFKLEKLLTSASTSFACLMSGNWQVVRVVGGKRKRIYPTISIDFKNLQFVGDLSYLKT